MSIPFVLPNINDSDGSPVTASDPQYLRAGDSWSWRRYFAGYTPADGWALQFILNSPTARFAFPAGSVTASADGKSWIVSLSSTQTRLVNGVYELLAVLTNAGTTMRETIAVQNVTVAPSIADAEGPVDTRSFVKRTLDMIEAAIAGDTRPNILEYEISGRRIGKLNPRELKALRDQYRMEYNSERRKRGEYVPVRNVRVSFGRGY